MTAIVHCVRQKELIIFDYKIEQFRGRNIDNSYTMVEKMNLKQFALIIVAMSFVTVNKGHAIDYKEPDILQKAVNEGSLPKISERLPKDPKIISIGSIGKYGGRLKSFVPGPTAESPETDWLRRNYLAEYSYDLKKIEPEIAKSWQLSNDSKALRVKLREGMKWSDGAELTTKDVEFYYKSFLLNKKLNSEVNKKLKPGGKVVNIKVIDKYTFEYEFAVPYPIIIDLLPSERPFYPKHYLAKYHIDHNPDANELAKKEGFADWIACFQYHILEDQAQQDPDYPTLDTWVYEKTDTASNRYYIRNPYYFKVDKKGNQLPYIDGIERLVVENKEIITGKILGGTATHASWYLQLPDYPLLKENEEKANMRVDLYGDTRSSEYGFAFNYTHKNKNKKDLFNNLKFRKAMSYAINREEINELIFLGLAVPRQPIADPSASFFEKDIDTKYIEYNPELANRLLDELGLKKDGKFRNFENGENLNIVLEFWSGKANSPEISELIKGYWEKVGIQTSLKPSESTYYRQRLVANETDLGTWAIGGGSEIYSRRNAPIRWRPPWHWPHTALGGVEWWNWYNTNGERGSTPPKTIQRLFELNDSWRSEARGTENYLKIGREILKINAENLWLIGTVGLVKRVGTVSKQLRNGPKAGSTLSVEYQMWDAFYPEQWWLEN